MSLISRRVASVLRSAGPASCAPPTMRPPRLATPAATPALRRHLHALALAPAVFGGLLATLWAWKCAMMVVFQDRIIYMPGLPPGARRARIADHVPERAGGVRWREERVRAADGTDLALCVADGAVRVGRLPAREDAGSGEARGRQAGSACFYVVYFQGNASSIPPRLPDLSATLSMLQRRVTDAPGSVRLTFVCLSYRGYWTSKGRPTEKGIRLDSAAALDWVSQNHACLSGKGAETPGTTAVPPARVILWGQSIGAGVATNLAAERPMPENLRLDSLILETPFTSVRAMLEILYPQRWLPYKHLWPFLWNHLDSWKNLSVISEMYRSKKTLPSVLILEAARDELVPAELSGRLHDKAVEVGLPVYRKAVSGAFHNDTMFRAEGRQAVSQFIFSRIETAVKGQEMQ